MDWKSLVLFIHVLTRLSADGIQKYTTRICEHTASRTIKCSSGRFLNVTYANYGRLSLAYCPQQSVVINCSSFARSLSIVQRKCHGLNSCVLEATNFIFGDPCVGIVKYLEVNYTCLEGDAFPSIPDLPNAYIYSNQQPHAHITNINISNSVFAKQPFYYSIFKTTEIRKLVQGNKDIYADALSFLLSPKIILNTKGSICQPNVDGQASEFCIYLTYGSLHVFNWFIPGWYVGKSYQVGILLRDSSGVPVVRKANLTVSVVPQCFPITEMYKAVASNCPRDSRRFAFPASLPWSVSSYGKRLPISVSSNNIALRVFIDINLLANFEKSSSLSMYNISLSVKDRSYSTLFAYSTLVSSTIGFTGHIQQVTGQQFNITLNAPISTLNSYINISLWLIYPSGPTPIIFNSPNAISLYGFNRIEVCPGSTCLNAYRPWLDAVEKLRKINKTDCIKDDYMQEEYLKPCRSETIFRNVEIPYGSPASYIIYQLKNEIDFGDIIPTFFRVVNYTTRGISYPGYSLKYFCNPAPFNDFRQYICLNRYAGRLRVRNKNFARLPVGEQFIIDVQAEATVNGRFHVRYCTFRLAIFGPTIVTTNATKPTVKTNATITTARPTATTTATMKNTTTTTAGTNATKTTENTNLTTTTATTTDVMTNATATTVETNATTDGVQTNASTTTTTTITLPVSLSSTKPTLPPVEYFCSNVAVCNQSYNKIYSERYFSLENFLTYSLENSTAVRFKLWSVNIEENFTFRDLRVEIYGLHGLNRISIRNVTVIVTNSHDKLIVNSSLPYNCNRIALRLLAMSNNGLKVMDVSQIKHVTITLVRFPFCEDWFCVELNSNWRSMHPGYSCAGSPFDRFHVCSELLLFVPGKPLYNLALNLTCKGSASSIVWYKDNKLLQVMSKVLTLSGQNYNDQGYYRCASDSTSSSVTSKEILVKYSDVITTTIYLDILNKIFTTDLKRKDTTAYKELNANVVRSVGNVLVNLKTKSPHDITVQEFSDGQTSVIAKLKVYSRIQDGTDIDSFYLQMKNSLLTAATNNGFEGLLVSSQSIIVISHEYCLAEETNKGESKGPYRWPRTEPGRLYSASCPNGPAGAFATRACQGNYTHGVVWQSIEDSKCNFNNPRSSKLNSLSKTTINSSNAVNVAEDLGQLTTSPSNLTSDDTIFASETFSNLVTFNITDKLADSLLVTASNLLNANKRALASSQSKGKALTSIVKGIETLADKIPLPNKTGQPVVRVSSGVAIQAVKVDASQSVITFALNAPEFKSENVVSNKEFKTNDVEIGISVPNSILRDIGTNGANRLSFVVYGGSQFFQTTKLDGLGKRVEASSASPNSFVISGHVKGRKRVNLSRPLHGTFKKLNQSNADKCVFWDFDANDGFGEWSSEGCRQVQSDSQRVVCQCDHMTNFAILFDVYAGQKKASDEKHEQILGIISFIGVGLSLGGLILTLLTLSLFRRLRRNLPSRILMHLCLSLMLTLIAFVAGADMTRPVYACRAFAIAIQYFLLVCFCWMIVEAVNLYLSFVVVMGSYVSKFMIKAGVFAWGLPIIIVTFTAWQRITEYGNERYCVVTGVAAYATMFTPICLALLINTITFILVFRALSSSAKGKKITKAQKRDGFAQLRIAAAFTCILGLTWVFGLFAIADARIVFQYLFCIFNSLQGFTIFYLHVARQQEARGHWIHFLTGKGLNYYRSSMISSSKAKSAKSGKADSYRMRTASNDQSGTLTSTVNSSDTLKSNVTISSSN